MALDRRQPLPQHHDLVAVLLGDPRVDEVTRHHLSEQVFGAGVGLVEIAHDTSMPHWQITNSTSPTHHDMTAR